MTKRVPLEPKGKPAADDLGPSVASSCRRRGDRNSPR